MYASMVKLIRLVRIESPGMNPSRFNVMAPTSCNVSFFLRRICAVVLMSDTMLATGVNIPNASKPKSISKLTS